MRLPAATVPFLRAALSGQVGAWPRLPAEVTDDLAAACRWHGVLPLLHDAFRRAPVEVPVGLVGAAHDGYLAAAAALALWRPERTVIADAMRQAGLRMVMLKGAALAGWLYRDAASRPIGDLDILVAEPELGPAAGALTALGYVRADPEAEAWQHHWVFARELADGVAITVELHRRAMASPPYDRLLDTDDLLDRSIELSVVESTGVGLRGCRAVEGVAAAWRVPALADCLLHLSGHLVLQHAGEERLIWVSDIHRVACAGREDPVFWIEVCERAEAARLARSVADALRMSALWFGTPIARPVLATLDESVSRDEQRSYRRLRARAPVGREGARALTDARGIAPVRDRLRYALAYAFPSRDYMRARYRPGCSLALPVYYGRRLLNGIGDVLRHLLERRSRSAEEPPERRMVAP